MMIFAIFNDVPSVTICYTNKLLYYTNILPYIEIFCDYRRN